MYSIFQTFPYADTSFIEKLISRRTKTMVDPIYNFFSKPIATDNALCNNPQQIGLSHTNRKPLIEDVVEFFQQENWDFFKVKGEPTLVLHFQGDNGRWFCHAKVREAQKQFIFYSICPINASQEKRLAVAEFLIRANYDLSIGKFELDFTDGEIRCKTSVDLEERQLDSPLLKRLVYINLALMDSYLPGIESVIYKDVSAVDAIAQIEGG